MRLSRGRNSEYRPDDIGLDALIDRGSQPGRLDRGLVMSSLKETIIFLPLQGNSRVLKDGWL